METSQAQDVADAMLALPDKPTQRDHLAMANKLWRAGFRHGVMAQGRHHEVIQGVIGKLMERRA